MKKSSRLRILYVGAVGRDGTCRQRLRALGRMGHTLLAVDTLPPYGAGRWRVLRGLMSRTNELVDWRRANHKLLAGVRSFRPDLVWVDKGLLIRPWVLQRVRGLYPLVSLVHYSPDDMMNPFNQSKLYLASIPVYHLHVTTKSYNVKELKEIGARHVMFVDNAFDESVHFPRELSSAEMAEYKCCVGFVGGFEAERFATMQYLARNGVDVVFRCPDWSHFKRRYEVTKGLTVIERWYVEDDYAKVVSATKVNLGFLRKCNRDRQTQRSVEIPACGGFMLAERTNEHLGLFKEGEEAEFFDSGNELLQKARFYLENPNARESVAQHGYQRCLQSGYGNQCRLRMIIEEIP